MHEIDRGTNILADDAVQLVLLERLLKKDTSDQLFEQSLIDVTPRKWFHKNSH
jgi:hypothetical protein